MASRQRILYASKAVNVGGTNLPGVQSCTYGFELARTDVQAFGKLAAHDRLLTTTPTVTVEVQRLAEKSTGIVTKQKIMTNAAANMTTIVIGLDNGGSDPDHRDFTSVTTKIEAKGCFVSSATAEASVGAFALQTVGFEGTGLGTGGTIGVPATATASPQERVSIGTQFSGGSFLDVEGVAQSCNMTVNVTREILEKFHKRFSDQRLIQFPSSATMTQEGLDLKNTVDFTEATKFSEASAGRINAIFKIDTKKYGLTGAIADSVTFNGGIGDNHTVSVVYSASIGSLADTTHNFSWHE